MIRLIIFLLCSCLLVISFSQQEKRQRDQFLQEFLAAEKHFQQAEAYTNDPNYNEEKEESLYRVALSNYQRLLTQFIGQDDSLLFHAYSRTALISYYLDSLDDAKINYDRSIQLKERLPSVPDSFLFKPYLYNGGIYYVQNLFDSAFYSFKKAEEIQDKYKIPLEESQRLYNRLGVMYYETGNYRLAKNYFEKAIAALKSGPTPDLSLLVNYQINIASILIKLEDYEEAKLLYQNLLPYKIYTNEINHNLGIIEIKLGDSYGALDKLKKVNYGENKKNIDLYYNYATTYSELKRMDSSDHYLSKAISENQVWNKSRKNVQYGLILKFQAEKLIQQGKIPEALEKYQQAIMQFHLNFNATDIYSNPAEFGGIFSYLNLFSTLTDKATAFALLHGQTKEIKQLEASLDAYRSAFALAAYVERTYESDEARLFLNKIKYNIHNRPIYTSIQLYELSKDKAFLEDAYYFDQLNKASTLSLNMQEVRAKNELTTSTVFFEEETKLKHAIARLTLRSSQVTDSLELDKLFIQIRENEISLSKIQEELNKDPQYRERYFSNHIPRVGSIFKSLDKKTAILSYHLSPDELLTQVITNKKIDYRKTPIDKIFYDTIDSLKSSLHEPAANKFKGQANSKYLYRFLISPMLSELRSVNRLIIIPDDELHYLPFEALTDENDRYLLEKFSIQYHYSTSLLFRTPTNKLDDQLAFAPFASESFKDSQGVTYNALPASTEEIKEIRGKIFIDTTATRKNFVDNAGKFGIIHLATHAQANNEQPNLSYIAFSPGKDRQDHRLYAEEIYTLDLDSSDLIILSACETGSGQLIKGEGLMSLSRAFAYAGCPNIITSLWKAEDRSTAYIARQLHRYLDKGLSKDKALQKAKLDLLKDDKLDPRYKSPNYWAHLVFIGDYEKNKKTSWTWILGGLILVLVSVYFIKRRKIL